MNSPNNSSSTPTAGPVATAQPPTAASKSERLFLKEQAAIAKTAFKQTLSEVLADVGTGVSPKEWTKVHPWIMLSASAAVGFTTACLAVPSREQQALRRLERIEKALRVRESDNHHAGNGKSEQKKEKRRGLMAVLTAELLRAATGIITTLMKSGNITPATQAMKPGAPTAQREGNLRGAV